MSREGNETRTRILEASVRTLEKSGGHGVRMGDIAKGSGISRQAVYLHFASRTELLVATTQFLDKKLDIDTRLAASRVATSGLERLDLYIECWGNYIPEIYSVAKALMLAQSSDDAAAAAWSDRMRAMRDGCRAAVAALHKDKNLAPGWTRRDASDALWAMLLVPNWEALTIDCGWSSKKYIRCMKIQAKRAFVKNIG